MHVPQFNELLSNKIEIAFVGLFKMECCAPFFLPLLFKGKLGQESKK